MTVYGKYTAKMLPDDSGQSRIIRDGAAALVRRLHSSPRPPTGDRCCTRIRVLKRPMTSGRQVIVAARAGGDRRTGVRSSSTSVASPLDDLAYSSGSCSIVVAVSSANRRFTRAANAKASASRSSGVIRATWCAIEPVMTISLRSRHRSGWRRDSHAKAALVSGGNAQHRAPSPGPCPCRGRF